MNNRRVRSPIALALCMLALAGQAAPAYAQGARGTSVDEARRTKPLAEALTGDAKQQFEAGRILYRDGDYGGASMKFLAAYETSKDARLLWNAAACEKNLRHYVKTESLVTRYVAEMRGQLAADAKESAEQLLETIRVMIGDLTIAVDEPHAQVFVDDILVGTSPLAKPIRVDLGTRRIRVKKVGFEDAEKILLVEGAKSIDLQIALKKVDDRASLAVIAEKGAVISLDGAVVGSDRWEGAVQSGSHTIEVTAPNSAPYTTTLELAPHTSRTVNVVLRKENKSTMWIWVTGGAVAVAGLAVGGYFLFRPADRAEPPAGNLPPGIVTLQSW